MLIGTSTKHKSCSGHSDGVVKGRSCAQVRLPFQSVDKRVFCSASATERTDIQLNSCCGYCRCPLSGKFSHWALSYLIEFVLLSQPTSSGKGRNKADVKLVVSVGEETSSRRAVKNRRACLTWTNPILYSVCSKYPSVFFTSYWVAELRMIRALLFGN
jgi:hypothetical protein